MSCTGACRAHSTPRWRSSACSRRRRDSLHRRRVDDAAPRPQLIDAARNAELAADAEIALVHLAVIADVPHDVRRPVARKPKRLAVIALRAKQAAHLRLRRFE